MFLLIEYFGEHDYFTTHFNTSHVSINPARRAYARFGFYYFNTSHVSINRGDYLERA